MPDPGQTEQDWYAPFIVRSVGDEVLVYDLRTQGVSTLTAFAAKVWRAWDRNRDAGRIADALKRDGVFVADLKVIERVLGDLARAGLIEQAVPVAKVSTGRRGFLKGWFPGALAASVAAPAVVSIVAPSPAFAASVVACNSNANCAAPTPVCVVSVHTCVQCTSNSECSGVTPTCTNNVCRGCTTNSQCGVGKICSGGACLSGCTTDANCNLPTGKCNTQSHVCVQCLANNNCANPKPICVSGTCTKCTTSSQCSVGMTCTGGSCVNANIGCTSNSECSGVNPFCNLNNSECVECLVDGNCEDAFDPYCVNYECADSRP